MVILNAEENSSLEEYHACVHQVAGHYFTRESCGKSSNNLLQTVDGLIMKPLLKPPKGDREHNLYRRIFLTNESDLNSDELALKKFIPQYRGFNIINCTTYLKIDDLTHGLKYPAVIDLKIGQQTFDPEANEKTISRHKIKYPHANIGFQIEGMRVFDQEKCTFSLFDKLFGRGLNKQDVTHGLGLFFQFHQNRIQLSAIKECISILENIREWFRTQKTFHFYSSSLIMVYEADLEKCLDSLNQQDLLNISGRVRVKLVDFAHLFPAHGLIDTNCLNGITKIIENLNMLLNKDYVFKNLIIN